VLLGVFLTLPVTSLLQKAIQNSSLFSSIVLPILCPARRPLQPPPTSVTVTSSSCPTDMTLSEVHSSLLLSRVQFSHVPTELNPATSGIQRTNSVAAVSSRPHRNAENAHKVCGCHGLTWQPATKTTRSPLPFPLSGMRRRNGPKVKLLG